MLNKELIKIDLSPDALVERNLVSRLLEINSATQKHGLILTEAIAKEITEARQHALKVNDRVDFSSDTVTRLVKAFSQSYYITQENFSEIIGEILDLFYFLKNEIKDALSDDEMISEMLIVFNDYCAGEIELMQNKGVEIIIRKHRFREWADLADVWDRSISSGEFVSYYEYDGEEQINYDETWKEQYWKE